MSHAESPKKLFFSSCPTFSADCERFRESYGCQEEFIKRYLTLILHGLTIWKILVIIYFKKHYTKLKLVKI